MRAITATYNHESRQHSHRSLIAPSEWIIGVGPEMSRLPVAALSECGIGRTEPRPRHVSAQLIQFCGLIELTQQAMHRQEGSKSETAIGRGNQARA
jgi:hypothetical protein